MTFNEAKEELLSYKYLLDKRTSEKQRYLEMCSEYSSLNVGNPTIRVQGGEKDYGRTNLLDKLRYQQVKLAQANYDVNNKAETIIAKLDKLQTPYNRVLYKIYIENKSLTKTAYELFYNYYWANKLHIEAIKKYAEL